MRRLLAAVAVVLLLSGCLSSPRLPTGVPVPQETTPGPAELEELRWEFGLPDCPQTDPDAVAVAGGLPETALQCLGSPVTVNLAGLPREPMVINFWAQWCGPCREEAPFLREIAATSDVTFLGINYDDPKPDWAIEFAGLVEWFYPHIQDMDRELQSSIGVPGLPMTLFVNADGQVEGRHPGQIHSEQELLDLMQTHLGTT